MSRTRKGTAAVASILTRLTELEAEEKTLVAAITNAARQTDIVAMHPKALESYLAEINRLSAAVRDQELQEAFGIVRRLVDHVVIYPRKKGEPVIFEIAGKLAALIDPQVCPLVPRGGLRILPIKLNKNRHLWTAHSSLVYHSCVSRATQGPPLLQMIKHWRDIAGVDGTSSDWRSKNPGRQPIALHLL